MSRKPNSRPFGPRSPQYATIHSHVLQDVLARLDTMYQAFLRRVQRGEQAGFPRCKGRERFHSCTYKQYGNGARIAPASITALSSCRRLAASRCAGLGHCRAAIAGQPLQGSHCRARPRRALHDQPRSRWVVCGHLLRRGAAQAHPCCSRASRRGSTSGLESFATLADGSPIANPRILRVAELNLKRAQRRVSRRKKGSHRRALRRAVTLLAKAHQTVRRARADFQHTTALALVRAYDTIAHEALQPANMLRTHHLAKRSSDASWSGFLAILSCTAAAAGKTVVAVPAAFTSHACSGCGVLVHNGVSVRWHLCLDGGTSLHRDHNAACNIVRLGAERRGAGQAPQARTWPGGPSVA